ncbi:unnamed protein product [Clonostachys rhizophaga]|uniref:F-box domain-containing protein n=1 Tax=Clonostachys rhizophaga TaxID=160324 RepID=A0A9N9VC00_9HYPO|nr:unnamed protein product [Clonostachys rhizophaga]
MDASLLSLPPELQTRILSHLISDGGIQSVHPLLYTCKQLHSVALPLSVQVFRLKHKSSDSTLLDRTRALQFLRYITIVKPELAKHVRTLIIPEWLWPQFESPLAKSGPTVDEMKVYKGLITKTMSLDPDGGEGSDADQAQWIAELEKGHSQAIYAMLVIVCTGLKDFCFGASSDRPYFHRILELAARYPSTSTLHQTQRISSPLSNVTEIYHEARSGQVEWDFQPQWILRLPSLRSYECVMVSIENKVVEAIAEVPPGSCSIEHIYLRKSRASATAIAPFLAICKSLRSFEYIRQVDGVVFDEMMPVDLMIALRPHAKTLEHLHVNFDDDRDKRGWGAQKDKLCMGFELRTLSALKTLTIGYQPLTGMLDSQPYPAYGEDNAEEVPLEAEGSPRLVECLPGNLERLEILSCGEKIIGQVDELLQVISLGTSFKRLTCIRLLFNNETIDLNGVDYSKTSPHVKIEVVSQTAKNRAFDMSPGCVRRGQSVNAICSRLQAPHLGLRQEWLDNRCSDQAWVSADGGIVVTEPDTGILVTLAS